MYDDAVARGGSTAPSETGLVGIGGMVTVLVRGRYDEL